ncbi:MAG: hypothetical protein LPK45_01845 [Bacteroidota bacterium]|nr:hypothetical protein [Bacteroidota bacterium]MDX5429776.1 hypothetical protein [Bacteroidota bacterium]MDX5468555.1 hypothetical protein [Bacteroidota bacterium]
MDAINYRGGKAKGLQNLQRHGLKVPSFVEWVFPSMTLPDEESAIYKDFLAQIAPLKYPILLRSNLAMEDGVRHSFAGVFSSSLPIHSPKDLHEALRLVLHSYGAQRAQEYFERNQIPSPDIFPVLVQEFIEPDAAGVVLSTLPEYPDELAIHFVKGHAARLVEGEEEGQAYHFHKIKREWLEEDIPGWAINLCEKTIRLEEQFGYPLDVEFAYQGQELYFVQVRPLTQAIPERLVLDNSNIQESYYGVSSPLTFSFAQHAYATVYRQTMRLMRIDEKQIASYQDVLDHLLYQYKGRIYYVIKNWYAGLLLLPSFKRNKADMEAMMGLEHPLEFIHEDQRSLGQRFMGVPGLLSTFLRMLLVFRKLPGNALRFRLHFRQAFDSFYSEELSDKSKEELVQKWEYLNQHLLQNWTIPIVNDFHVMMLNGQLKRKASKIKGYKESWIHELMAQDLDIESMTPHRFYLKMASQLKEDKEACEQVKGEHAHRWLLKNRPDLAKEIDQFIHDYGDRVAGELKLETVTMRLDPSLFYAHLKNYLDLDRPSNKVPSGDLLQLANTSVFKKFKAAVERREALRMDRTRLFGMYRSLFLEMGTRLKDEGKIQHQREVFMFSMEELKEALLREGNWQSLVNERQKEMTRFEAINVPGHIVLPQRQVNPSRPLEEGVLCGQAILGNALRGEAVVYKMQGPVPELKDKILIAPRTDPGWVPLFPACKAVLIEKGSALSHSVILLREMGIPCMINIPGLTEHVQSGMQLSLNFEEGTIEIVE